MGHISVVYGRIIGESWNNDYHKLMRLNKNIIKGLPANYDNFPWITRNMFSAPDPDQDHIYCSQAIAFGASYKSVEHEWDEWLDRFEAILKQLYWSSAIIHLETELVGDHKYEWLADLIQPDNWISENPQPTTIWTFNGGPRKFFDNYKKIDHSGG